MAAREPTLAVYHQTTTGNRLRLAWAATRPAFLSASLLPVLVGLALAWREYGVFRPLTALLTLITVVCAHAGANVLNDYYDAPGDAANHGRIFPFSGGSRFIQNGVLSRAATGRLALGLLTVSGLAGLGLTLHYGPLLLLLGLAGGGLAVVYSAPPCLACRGLGDVTIALCFGVLPLLATVWLQSGVWSATAGGLGLAVGCFAAAILWVNSIPDIPADRAVGKFTLPARLGAVRARWGLPVLFALGFLLLPAGYWPSGLALLPALAASITLLRGRLLPAIPLTLLTHTAVCLLLIGFLLSEPA